AVLEDLVLGGGQVAGVSIEGLKQAMKRACGDVADVGVGDVVRLNPLEHFGIDVHLAVSAILLAAGMDAEQSELTKTEAEAEGGENRRGKNEEHSLKESRHTHHRGGPGGTGRLLYRRNDSARGVLRIISSWQMGTLWLRSEILRKLVAEGRIVLRKGTDSK